MHLFFSALFPVTTPFPSINVLFYLHIAQSFPMEKKKLSLSQISIQLLTSLFQSHTVGESVTPPASVLTGATHYSEASAPGIPLAPLFTRSLMTSYF